MTTPVATIQPVAPSTARMLAWAFVLLILIPGAMELLGGPSKVAEAIRADYRRLGIQLAVGQVETQLIFDSRFARVVRPPYQQLLTAGLRQGSERVIVGSDGWLFPRDDYDFSIRTGVIAPRRDPVADDREPPQDALELFLKKLATASGLRRPSVPRVAKGPWLVDPITCLADFGGQLERRGIHLLVVIVPAKTAIYPEKLNAHWSHSEGPAVPVGYAEWKSRLDTSRLDVIDLTESFWRQKSASGSPELFLEQDSHWSPAGVAIAADLVAGRVRPYLPETARSYATKPLNSSDGPHDLLRLLELTGVQARLPSRPITLSQVFENGVLASVDEPAAPILLFGDSMTAYYDDPNEPDGGTGAGLAAQLVLRLGQPVQRFSRPGGGADLIRDALNSHPGLLRGRKVVVWELVMRGLANNKLYSLIPIDAGR